MYDFYRLSIMVMVKVMVKVYQLWILVTEKDIRKRPRVGGSVLQNGIPKNA